MTKLFPTHRALSDINVIEHDSVEHWGSQVADKDLTDLEAAIGPLAEDLSLFKERHDYTGRLRFYDVRKHVLVGDVINQVVFILTVWHGSMDFIDRLPTIQPDLMHETEIMVQIDAKNDTRE